MLRANVLGDLIFTLPALDALRAAYPHAEIVLLGRPWHAPFFAGRPSALDRVVAIPPTKGLWEEPDRREDAAVLDAFCEALADEHFDLGIQLHGGGRYSTPFLQRLKPRVTAGLRDIGAPALDRWLPYVYYQSEPLRLLEVVSLVGAHPVGIEPRLAVTEQDLAAAERAWPSSTAPLVALHPGAGDARRRWPPAKFAAVGDAAAAAGAQVVITGTAEEAALIDHVAGDMAQPAGRLGGALSLSALAGLLSRCAVVIANDSGPLHLAAAVGSATVGVFWCGNLINAGPPTRARHRPAISWRLECPACGLNCIHGTCDHTASFVADVTVAEVRDAALDLLAAAADRPG